MRLANWANYSEQVALYEVGETNNAPSETIPGQTLGLEELLKRFVRGQDVKVFTPTFLGDDSDVPDDLERMNEMDKLDMARELRQGIRDKQDRMAAAKKEKEKEKPAPAPAPAPPPSGDPAPPSPGK